MDRDTDVWSHQCWVVSASPVDGRLVFDQAPYSWIARYRKEGWRVYTFQDQKARENFYVLLKTKDHCFKFAEYCKERIKGKKCHTIRLSLDHVEANTRILTLPARKVIT